MESPNNEMRFMAWVAVAVALISMLVVTLTLNDLLVRSIAAFLVVVFVIAFVANEVQLLFSTVTYQATDEKDLAQHFEQGWECMLVLPSGKVLLRKRVRKSLTH